MLYRSFVDIPLKKGDLLELSKEELHHIKKVLRIAEGDHLELVNGKGDLAIGIYQGSIKIHSTTHTPKSPYKKILALANPLQNHLEFIIEKATELGITHFFLFPSTKSPIPTYSAPKKDRLTKITISALKQCKRLHLPEIIYLPSLQALPPATYYLGDPKGSPPRPHPDIDVGFIIGPESGFTPDELSYFTHYLKAHPTKLSDNILRCETAAIVSAFLITSHL